MRVTFVLALIGIFLVSVTLANNEQLENGIRQQVESKVRAKRQFGFGLGGLGGYSGYGGYGSYGHGHSYGYGYNQGFGYGGGLGGFGGIGFYG